jgi:uncharacterized phiE125 gp8 family phage protein
MSADTIGRYSLITGPLKEPIDLQDLKNDGHMRVTVDDEDAYIIGLIVTARELAERFQGRAYITQTWDLYLDLFPETDTIELFRAPVQSVTSITYTPDGGSSTTFAASNYAVDTRSAPGPSDQLQSLDGLVIRFIAGYGDEPQDVPADIRHALMKIVADLYENRESYGPPIDELPTSAMKMLSATRTYGPLAFA